MSTYADIVAALVTRFKTVPGLSKRNNDTIEVGVLDYEPKTLQHSPVFYGILTNFDRRMQGQQIEMTYIMAWRLCVQWVGNQVAEATLRSFVNAIPAAIDTDRYLGNVIMGGGAKISQGQAGYFNIGDAKYRYIDFRVEILHKEPVGSGI